MELYELKQKQSLALNSKIIMSKERIKQFYEKMEGNVYVSFSGGKDSTVLLNLVRECYPDVKAVFCDTGLEYPEIRKFAIEQENVEVVRPKMSFKQVIESQGYPVISKEQSLYIRQFCTTKSRYLEDVRWNGKNGRFKISEKWKFLVNAPFNVSERCCDILKKNPLKRFEKQSGLKPYVGTMASDSRVRERMYLRDGCNVFKEGKEKSQPLSFWLEEDIWKFIRTYNYSYSEIYDMGIDRTGCIFCLFGIHMEKNSRFKTLHMLHPKLYDYCMTTLGIKKVIDYINDEGSLKKKIEY